MHIGLVSLVGRADVLCFVFFLLAIDMHAVRAAGEPFCSCVQEKDGCNGEAPDDFRSAVIILRAAGALSAVSAVTTATAVRVVSHPSSAKKRTPPHRTPP